MAYSVNDRVKRLVENPETLEVLKKHAPELMAAPQVQQAYGMSFRALAEFPTVNLSQAIISAIDQDLQDVDDEDDE